MRIFSATRLAYTVILTGIAGALQMQHRRNTTTQNPCADLILRPFGKKTTNHYESLPLIEKKKKKNMNQCTLPHLSRLLTSCMLRHVSQFVLPPNGQLELPSAGVGDTRSAIPSHSKDSTRTVLWVGPEHIYFPMRLPVCSTSCTTYHELVISSWKAGRPIERSLHWLISDEQPKRSNMCFIVDLSLLSWLATSSQPKRSWLGQG